MRKDLGVKAYLYPQPTLVIATYNEDGSTNAMVAAWGSISDTNQVAIYVAHSHKTMPNILARKAFTVSMATAKNIKAIDYLGVTSGNKVADKFAHSGLTSVKSVHVDAPLIAELPLALDETGKLSVEKLAPVCYDSAGHGYYVMERRVGNAFSDGKLLGNV